jgi:hypothetical protein
LNPKDAKNPFPPKNREAAVMAAKRILGTYRGDETIMGHHSASDFVEECTVGGASGDLVRSSSGHLLVPKSVAEEQPLPLAYLPMPAVNTIPLAAWGRYMMAGDFTLPPREPKVNIRHLLPKFSAIPPITPEPSAESRAALQRSEARIARPADYVAPLIGYRIWEVGETGLEGLASGTWPPLVASHAVCLHASHEAPDEGCACGIWAFKTLGMLQHSLSRYKLDEADYVAGRVYLWGIVVECENGWRAEFAYPAELWLPDKSFKRLGSLYNVPVKVWEPEIKPVPRRQRDDWMKGPPWAWGLGNLFGL